MKSLTKIGRDALTRLLSSARFRPQNKDAGFNITFSETDFDLEGVAKNCYRRDHMTQYRADQRYMVWGIELGLKQLRIPQDCVFSYSIIEQAVPDSNAPLPSHFIVNNWSNSDFHEDESYTVLRLSDAQDVRLRELREHLKALAT